MIHWILIIIVLWILGTSINYAGVDIMNHAFELAGGDAIGSFCGGLVCMAFGVFLILLSSQVICIIRDWRKKMKDLWTKFKRWLIKKLGGYVSPQPVTYQHEVVHHRVEPINIVNVTTFSAREIEYMDDADMVQKTVERRVSMAIAAYIMENKLYKVEQCIDPISNELRYAVRVSVVSPNKKPTPDDFNNYLVGRYRSI